MTKRLETIEAMMNGLRHLSHEDLLIFAASVAVDRMNRTIPEGYTLQTYAEKMLLKGTELGKEYQARVNAEKKLANDPKQAAKRYVHDCWENWQLNSTRFKSKADFARNMLNHKQCECLQDTKTIEGWCRAWKKKH